MHPSDLLDLTHDPVVEIKVPANSEPGRVARFHAALDWLIVRGRGFVVVIEGAGDEEQESHEDRTERALWFKANMERIAACCRGMIYIECDDTKRAEWQRRAAAMAQAFPVLMVIARSHEEALSEAKKLVSAP